MFADIINDESIDIIKKLGFNIFRSDEHWTVFVLPNRFNISLSHHNQPEAGVKSNHFY